jgi:hypothetical protein
MSTTNATEKSIVVRAVQRRRYTDTNGQTVRRIVRFNGPILSSDLEAMKEGDQVTLWIEEAPQTQVDIGFLTTDEERREQLAREIQLRCRTPLSLISGMRPAALTLHRTTSRSK